ncbi:hypothetical protein FQR65_LT13034 [Abscondita terminalis]|nr:hypothetical protein FQR65_LT13034 [Abscondita terminalis]
MHKAEVVDLEVCDSYCDSEEEIEEYVLPSDDEEVGNMGKSTSASEDEASESNNEVLPHIEDQNYQVMKGKRWVRVEIRRSSSDKNVTS